MRSMLQMIIISIAFAGNALAGNSETEDVGKVLDALHQAASDADFDRYFSLYTDDAVFIGTDISERWPIEVFQDYARPIFATGTGWTYVMQERHVEFSADGDVAWFDENLWADKYGTSRGTGVLVKTPAGWKIAQYHLTFPIPNDLAAEMTARIMKFEGH